VSTSPHSQLNSSAGLRRPFRSPMNGVRRIAQPSDAAAAPGRHQPEPSSTRSQRQAHCAKPCGAVEPEPRELNRDRPRGNCRPVSHNSVFLSGDGLAAAPLMRSSAHLIDPIIIETHQDLNSEKRMRSLEPVDTEKGARDRAAACVVSPAGASGICCCRSRSPRPLPRGPAQHTRAMTQKAPIQLTDRCQQPGKPRHRSFGDWSVPDDIKMS
jgi:hypothetical protein